MRTCPDGFSPLIKPVVAWPGDLVSVSANAIRVNGRPLQIPPRSSATPKANSFVLLPTESIALALTSFGLSVRSARAALIPGTLGQFRSGASTVGYALACRTYTPIVPRRRPVAVRIRGLQQSDTVYTVLLFLFSAVIGGLGWSGNPALIFWPCSTHSFISTRADASTRSAPFSTTRLPRGLSSPARRASFRRGII